ncbi:hypothetical protein KY284_026741 [Solanum tuberosum]|nr:hypothetical protein KY284_026741 [Solanum tuberosum]
MDLDLALLNDKPTVITDKGSKDEKSFHKSWERSNRLSLMFMRMTVSKNIKSIIPQIESVREYLKFMEEHFRSADKSSTLMDEPTTMKFDGSHSMQNHIIDMTNIAAKLRILGMKMDDIFLVQFILNSLPKLTITLIRISGMLVNCLVCLLKKSQDLRNKEVISLAPWVNELVKDLKKEGHYQKDCLKHKAWFEKKGTFSAFGFPTIQTTNPNKDFLFMRNRMKAKIEGIGTYLLILDIGHHLDLLQTLYIPSVSRNLISFSRLDVSGFDF